MVFTKFSNGSISGIKYKNLRTNNPYTIGAFPAGNRSYQSLYDFGSSLVQYDAIGPSSGGTLTINGNSVGSYDYTIKRGNQTVSSFTNSDWFTTTADTVSAFIAVDGNLTIDSGVTFTPSNRKLFTCIYVNGDLTVNGTLTMNARGANHSATTKQNVRIITGTYSSVTDPQIPADGGSGATAVTSTNGNANGNNGTAGTAGGTGGGAGGGIRNNSGTGTTTGGAGAGGTSFSGGSGGSGVWNNATQTGGNGTANGGAGGNAPTPDAANATAYGGAGNAGGSNAGRNAATSSNGDGTGGILVIFVAGSLLGSGTISANGVQGKYYTGAETFGWSGGGGSGGGSVTIVYRYDSSTITPTATGGSGGPGGGSCASGICSGGNGGAGGAGTARKLALVA